MLPSPKRPSFQQVSGLPLRSRAVRRGVAAVEFAVIAPVFVVMLLGIIETGRAVMVQQVITNAAREGARVGVFDGATDADVESAANRYLTGAGIQGATISTTPSPPSSAAYGEPVSVTVSILFDDAAWLNPGFMSGRSLSATAVMRRETVE